MVRPFEQSILNPDNITNGKSIVEVNCVVCKSVLKISFKQFKYKIKNGSALQCRSCSIKKLWNCVEYREKNSQSQSKAWANHDLRSKVSEKTKQLWQKSDYVNKQKEIHADPDYINQTSRDSQLLWMNPDFRAHQKQIRSDPNWIHGQSERMKSLWTRDDYKKKVAAGLSKVFVKGFQSSIEIVTYNLLKMMGIDFEQQKVIGPFVFDFYLNKYDIFIECQGEYWHSINNVVLKDEVKLNYLKKSRPDSKLLYLYERDFLNPKIIEHKIKLFLGIIPTIELCEFDLKNVEIIEINSKLKCKQYRSIAQEFLDSYHYAAFGRSAKIVYGAYLNDKLIAVCKFSAPIRNEIATSMGFLHTQILELDRFCIHPSYHKKNFASWFIARCSKKIFATMGSIKRLVSFADTTYGHLGIIYKAANWKELHRTKPDYYYVSSDGWILHKKTLYNQAVKMSMTERGYVDKYDYKKLFGKEKIKFYIDNKFM